MHGEGRGRRGLDSWIRGHKSGKTTKLSLFCPLLLTEQKKKTGGAKSRRNTKRGQKQKPKREGSRYERGGGRRKNKRREGGREAALSRICSGRRIVDVHVGGREGMTLRVCSALQQLAGEKKRGCTERVGRMHVRPSACAHPCLPPPSPPFPYLLPSNWPYFYSCGPRPPHSLFPPSPHRWGILYVVVVVFLWAGRGVLPSFVGSFYVFCRLLLSLYTSAVQLP